MSYREIIRSEFEKRRSKNPSYSLRAFARDLHVPVSRLSEVLNGKGGVSLKRGWALAEKLNLDESQKDVFLKQLSQEKSLHRQGRRIIIDTAYESIPVPSTADDEAVKALDSWIYFLVMILLDSSEKGCLGKENLVALTGVSEDSIDQCLKKLESLRLIRSENGQFQLESKLESRLISTSSKAYQGLLKSGLQFQLNSFDKITVEGLGHIQILGVSTEQLSLLKKELASFKRRIRYYSEKSDKKEHYFLITSAAHSLDSISHLDL